MNWIDMIKDGENGWLLMLMEVSETHFKNYFTTPSKFYKMLSNSKRSVGGVTNREYFKMNVTGGFYSVIGEQGLVKILLCLQGEKIQPLQINVRVRKLIPPSSVRILDMNEFRNWDFESCKNQLVGQHYFNHQMTF